jgi:hypothetical protein
MYAGHLGIALGVRGWRRDAPMWLLVVATQACDWAQAVACVAAPAGDSAMWSHSVPAVCALAALLGLAAWAGTRSAGVALAVAGTTVSHILADYLTGDKPTWPGGPIIGLGLYNRPPVDLVIEVACVAAGWLIYRRSLPPEARARRLTWLLLAVLVAVQLAGVLKLAIMPPTPKCS